MTELKAFAEFLYHKEYLVRRSVEEVLEEWKRHNNMKVSPKLDKSRKYDPDHNPV